MYSCHSIYRLSEPTNEKSHVGPSTVIYSPLDKRTLSDFIKNRDIVAMVEAVVVTGGSGGCGTGG